MRRLLPLLLLCGACVDYDKLQKGFCETAMSGVSSTGVALCDDFENDGKSPAWTRLVNGGAVAVPDNPQQVDPKLPPFRGDLSMHLTVPPGGQAVLEDSVATRSLSAGDLYIRAFIHMFNASNAGTLEVYSVRDAAGMLVASLSLVNDHYVVQTPGRDTTHSLALAANAVAGKEIWICTELAIRRDALSTPPVPSVELWVDPNNPGIPPVAQLAGADLSDFATTRVGIDRSGGTDGGTTQLWMDEVIIDSQRIWCQK